jgi:hypothetical protein
LCSAAVIDEHITIAVDAAFCLRLYLYEQKDKQTTAPSIFDNNVYIYNISEGNI